MVIQKRKKNERKSCSMVKQRIDENLFILHGKPKFELFAVCSSRYQTKRGSLIKLWKGNHLSPWSLQQTSINTQRMIIYSLPLFPFRLLLWTWTLPRLLSEKARHGLPMALSLLPCNKLDKLRTNGKKFHRLCPSAIK